MPRMIELIRASAVPANLMQSAARGALSVPGAEMIEILVYLATQNKVFAEQASLTLAGWDEKSSREAAASPDTSREVLDYLVSPQNFRPALLSALLENSAISDEQLAPLMATVSRDSAEAILQNNRVTGSKVILGSLAANRNLSGIQWNVVEERLAALQPQAPQVANKSAAAAAQSSPAGSEVASAVAAEAETDPDVVAFITANAAEIAAEANKPFQPVGGIYEESEEEAAACEAATQEAASVAASAAAAAKAAAPKKVKVLDRGSALQKIAKLDITGRIQLAMKGSKEDRSLLIRDGTKIVALAVLDSPKLSDGEVEKFASQKNVLEAVLRQITMKRKFMKNYVVIRNLVANPRTPMDIALGLMKNLLINDLKNLSGNKEVPETIRKLALRMFKQKQETKKD
jgi:hypothetical protein